MRKFDFTRGIFLFTSILILITGFIVNPIEDAIFPVIGFFTIGSLIILDINSAKITNLSEDNPKIKTVKFLNRLSMFCIICMSIIYSFASIKESFESLTNGFFGIVLITIIMAVIGNVSPKIPFNRYSGLRLPWTIRDEETWKLAHRILGYLAFPIAILMIISALYFDYKKVAFIGITSWIAIPGIYSLIFYNKKFKALK